MCLCDTLPLTLHADNFGHIKSCLHGKVAREASRAYAAAPATGANERRRRRAVGRQAAEPTRQARTDTETQTQARARTHTQTHTTSCVPRLASYPPRARPTGGRRRALVALWNARDNPEGRASQSPRRSTHLTTTTTPTTTNTSTTIAATTLTSLRPGRGPTARPGTRSRRALWRAFARPTLATSGLGAGHEGGGRGRACVVLLTRFGRRLWLGQQRLLGRILEC